MIRNELVKQCGSTAGPTVFVVSESCYWTQRSTQNSHQFKSHVSLRCFQRLYAVVVLLMRNDSQYQNPVSVSFFFCVTSHIGASFTLLHLVSLMSLLYALSQLSCFKLCQSPESVIWKFILLSAWPAYNVDDARVRNGLLCDHIKLCWCFLQFGKSVL